LSPTLSSVPFRTNFTITTPIYPVRVAGSAMISCAGIAM
jgi:hypothetical protein